MERFGSLSLAKATHTTWQVAHGTWCVACTWHVAGGTLLLLELLGGPFLEAAWSQISRREAQIEHGGRGGEFNSERNAGVRTTLARLHCLRYHVFGLKFEVFMLRVF